MGEFKAGLEKMKCHKFIDPTIKDKALQASKEFQRISNVFRYLDPSGEGEVSEGEWGILMNLWKEMRQSIREFVQFLERTFSRKDARGNVEEDALDAAWEFIDDDGSGEISEDEWVAIVQESLHYFGPCVVIFHFLDKDDEGTVSLDEFRALEVFRR